MFSVDDPSRQLSAQYTLSVHHLLIVFWEYHQRRNQLC